MPRLAANVLLLVSSSVLGLFVAEAAARWFFPYPIVGWSPHVRQEIRGPGRPPVTYSTNSLGLRGDEPPPAGSGLQTILAVGGSTTHCLFLDDADAWPAQLQRNLRAAEADVWVGNGGLEGHSTNGHLLFVREVVAPLRPGTAVFLVGINDLLASLQGARPGLSGIERLWEAHALATRSRLLQLLAVEVLRRRAPRAQVAYRPWGNDRPISGPSRPWLFATRAQDGLRRYLDNVRRLASDTTALGVRPVFLTQPIAYEATTRWTTRAAPVRFADRQLRISASQTARLLGLYNRALLQLCRTERLDCFDLAARVPHDPRYFYDWVHFNEAGAALVAREVADFLLSRGTVTTGRPGEARATRSR